MVRLPCCDKIGIKKGPWIPEEDITLLSYIQEHGPGNWRSVPTNTGLLRCSKSCRLRWTNYLRPGIKRGNFTPHEEGMIIHLQALFGNKWAAIASYLPRRTDNDIKNYWNTHLRKKIKKLQAAMVPHMASSDSTNIGLFSKSDIILQDSIFRSNQAYTYASSTENISRLLEGWMRSPKTHPKEKQSSISENKSKMNNNGVETNSLNFNKPKIEQERSDDLISNEDFESLLSFENLNGIAWERSSSDSTIERKLKSENQTPVSLIETWLLDEATGPVQDMMELSSLL